MTHRVDFWKREHLSDAQLLESLGSVLRTQRLALAELVAHLGEVEDRRLHLEAACGSMFTYCVARLGMSEDEACRRISLARLARKFPALFAELAGGQLTLSVALLLKPVLSPSNQSELLSAARGKSIRHACELLAERFPKADARSSIRKLPERRPVGTSQFPDRSAVKTRATEDGSARPSATACPPPSSLAATSLTATSLTATSPASCAPPTGLPAASPPMPFPTPPSRAASALDRPREAPLHSSSVIESPARSAAPGATVAPPSSRNCIEPLSAQRYRIQFTADAGLKQKLEQTRDLLRHAHPSGDFGPIVARALDLLIDDLLRRRFGATHGKVPNRAAAKAGPAPSEGARSKNSTSSTSARPPVSEGARPAASTRTVASVVAKPRSTHISRAARRAVLERDGLGCSWVDAHGVRCGSQAWLEFDHRQPAGKGGSSEADNVRLLCRAHNRLAAEHAYGRTHIERTSTRRRDTQSTACPLT